MKDRTKGKKRLKAILFAFLSVIWLIQINFVVKMDNIVKLSEYQQHSLRYIYFLANIPLIVNLSIYFT